MSEQKSLIKLYAKELRLPSFARHEQVVREAEQTGLGYEEFLVRMMKAEIQNRRENQRKQRIRQAKLPSIKTLDTFEFANLPDVNPAAIWSLAECELIERKENIVLIGNPGTGKTHLATGLAMMACNKGYRVRFYTAATLVNDHKRQIAETPPSVRTAGEAIRGYGRAALQHSGTDHGNSICSASVLLRMFQLGAFLKM